MPPGGSVIEPEDRRPSWGGRLGAATVLVLVVGAAGITAWLNLAARVPSPPPSPLASAVIPLPSSAAPSSPQTTVPVTVPAESPPRTASLRPASAPATPGPPGRLQNGVAVAMGFVYPVTLDRLGQWIPTLERKGFALAPVSATADLQADRIAGAEK